MDAIENAVERLLESYERDGGVNHSNGPNLPSREAVVRALADVMTLVFPGFREDEDIDDTNIGYVAGSSRIAPPRSSCARPRAASSTSTASPGASGCPAACHIEARDLVGDFFSALPGIRALVMEDVDAAFRGDPAAKTVEEVILAYPGLEAVVVHRIANFFWEAGLPLIPRMMSEQVHSKTGIDIHPGAPSASASSSTTAPASSSARPRSSATT